MGFWNSVKGFVGMKDEPQQQPQTMVQIPLDMLSPEQKQFAQTAPRMVPKKGPRRITLLWKALNQPMVGRNSPGYQGSRRDIPSTTLTYPLPPVNKDDRNRRRRIW